MNAGSDGKRHGIGRYAEGCSCSVCRAWESEVTEADMRWITAYLRYLPKDRAAFPKEMRDNWLTAVAVALNLIYEASDEDVVA